MRIHTITTIAATAAIITAPIATATAHASDHSIATEIASQDWERMPDSQKQHACDLRGPNGGTTTGYRAATRYVIRHTDRTGRTHNRAYRVAVTAILNNC